MKTSFNDDIPSIEDRLCALELILHTLLASLPEETIQQFRGRLSRGLRELDRDQPELRPVAEEAAAFLRHFDEYWRVP
jgi:hypothetical protein